MMIELRQAFADWQIAAAGTVFLASYFVFAFGRYPGTKIDRPAMAMVDAVLMFVFRILTPKNAIERVDFGTLVLLFAMMLIVASLHVAGFFEWLSNRVSLHLTAPQLLPGVIFTSGICRHFW
jgi:Na+/H+ antiporter NhaD/arsenite permease-like protein